MINSRKFHSTGGTKLLSLAAAVAVSGISLALAFPAGTGVQQGLNGSCRALRTSGRHSAARVIALTGSAAVLGSARSRPLSAGCDLAEGEVVVTGAHSMLLVETADGGVYEIFPESRVRFGASGWTWLDLVNRKLKRIKARIQGNEGTLAPERLSSPTAVLAVRAALLPTSRSGSKRFVMRWIEMRS